MKDINFETVHVSAEEHPYMEFVLLIDMDTDVMIDKYPKLVAEKLTTGDWSLFQIDSIHEIDKRNQREIVASLPIGHDNYLKKHAALPSLPKGLDPLHAQFEPEIEEKHTTTSSNFMPLSYPTGEVRIKTEPKPDGKLYLIGKWQKKQ